VRLTLEIRGQTHKIGAASPDREILGTLPEGFLMLRVAFPGLRIVFLELRTSFRRDLRTSLIPMPSTTSDVEPAMPRISVTEPRMLGIRADQAIYKICC
jgi:hypothetical protein